MRKYKSTPIQVQEGLLACQSHAKPVCRHVRVWEESVQWWSHDQVLQEQWPQAGHQEQPQKLSYWSGSCAQCLVMWSYLTCTRQTVFASPMPQCCSCWVCSSHPAALGGPTQEEKRNLPFISFGTITSPLWSCLTSWSLVPTTLMAFSLRRTGLKEIPWQLWTNSRRRRGATLRMWFWSKQSKISVLQGSKSWSKIMPPSAGNYSHPPSFH